MSTNVPHALRCTPPAASHTHHLSFIVLNNTLDPGAAGVTTLAAEPCILLAGTPCGSKQPRHHTCAVSQHATRAARHRNTTYAHHVPTAHQRPSNCGPLEALGASPRTGGLQSQGQIMLSRRPRPGQHTCMDVVLTQHAKSTPRTQPVVPTC
jgi:hypothetical protein